MRDRIRAGICPGVISPAILDTIVQEIGEDSDLRMGIGILKCCVGLAKSDNRTSVTLTDVRTSIPTVRELHLNIAASILKEEEQKVLETIETLIRQHGEQMNARVLHREIKKIEKIKKIEEKEQIGYSKFSRFLIRYRDLGLITISRPPHIWGNTRNILTRRTTDPNKKDR